MSPAPSVIPEQQGPIFQVEDGPTAKGIAVRMAPEDAECLGLVPGDAMMVTGARSCAGRLEAWSDRASGTLLVSPVVRHNAGTRVGERVAIEKVHPRRARALVLAADLRGGPAIDRPPAGGWARLSRLLRRQPAAQERSGGFLLPALEGTPLLAGDRLEIEWLGRRERVRVVETVPDGVVLADGETAVSLVPLSGEDLSLGYDDIGGLGKEIARVREMVELPLYFPEIFERLGVEPPKGLLLYGPPGCGKTLIARAVARETRAHFLHVNGPEIIQKHYGESEEMLRALFAEAQQHPASIIFFDEIDALAPHRETVLGDVEKRVVAQLLALLDGVRGRGRVMVLAATNLPNNIDPALRRPGRLDREIAINPPDRAGRLEILRIHTRAMPLAEDVDLAQIAEVTHGFLGADLAALAREAAMLCARELSTGHQKTVGSAGLDLSLIRVEHAHFQRALGELALSTTRQFGSDAPGAHWADIGGLDDIKRVLRDAVEWPLRYGSRFEALRASPAKGILLTGAAGTGKTLLARAVGTESGVNFIAIKGPELISKWVGETERGIREVFKRARQSAPCILFFDELDAIVPVRGTDGGGGNLGERMVGQFLLEMDNTDQRAGVLVLAATNRPELVDRALLRPGRFDLVLDLPLPDEAAREAILEVHCRERRLDLDVSLREIAVAGAGMSGAGLAELCRRAAVLAIGDSIARQPGERFDPIVIARRYFFAAFAAEADRAGLPARRPGGSDHPARLASGEVNLAPAPSDLLADQAGYFAKNEEKISASEQILSAAIGCIARKGCTNVTMRDIADEAGVVLSQLSYYYRNKETLFSQVLRSMRRDYLLEIEAGMAACEGEEAKLRFLIRHNRHLLEHNADLYRAFLDFFNMALWSASFRTEMENFLGELAGAIRQQMALPPGTAGATGRPAILPEMILGTSFGIAMQFLINPEKNRAALAGFDLLEGLLVVPAAGRGAEG